jgi:hypothetical protein
MNPTGTVRMVIAGGAAVTLMLGLSACSVEPEQAGGWSITPLEFDGALEGSPESVDDVTYSMSIATDDTEGGLWTESAGSWLHLTAEGEATRRYNTPDDYAAAHGAIEVRGISAISPSNLVVSKTAGTEAFGPESGLFWYDTAAETWDKVHPDVTTTGDVDIEADGRIVFVDFLGQMVPGTYSPESLAVEPQPYAIRALDSEGELTTLLEPHPAVTVTAADAVDVDSDDSGTVYVSTETETFALDADGERSSLSTYAPQTPRLAVNAAGDVLMPSASSTTTENGSAEEIDDWTVTDGSDEARDVLDAHRACADAEAPHPGAPAPTTLSLMRNSGSSDAATVTVLPFSCGAAPIAFEDSMFVLAIGDEAGTVLARVTPPEQ